MRIDERHLLACDRSHFQRVHGARMQPMPLAKHPENPLILPDTPWEEDVHLYGAVLPVDGVYKMWYYARTESYGVRMTCYAESADGVHFVKPALDVCDYRGEKTNIVFGTPVMGEGFLESDTVLYTPWDTGAEYKMLYVARYERDAAAINAVRIPYYERMAADYRAAGDWQMERKALDRVRRELNRVPPPCVYVATSSDGIHWREGDRPAAPMIDDISHLMYDPDEREYRIYGRGFCYDEGRCRADRDKAWFDGYLGRAVFMARSRDALTWSDAVPVCAADAFDRPGDEIYSMNVFKWRKRYIGLVQMYHGAPDDMTLDIQLAISADGVRFERVGDRAPVIPLGDCGAWDRFNTCTDGAPVLADGRMRVYFNGAVFRHLRITGSCEYSGADTGARVVRVGMGEWLPDRFACACASFSGGELETVPLETAARTLHLNCESAFGEIAVTFAGERAGESARETVTVVKNGLDIAVPMPAFTREAPFSITFALRNARLYSFWAE